MSASKKTTAKKSKPTTQTEATPTKMSALDAAAKVLQETGIAMSTKEMIGAMTIKGYWTSPAGKTPHATLASAIQREIATKGEASRFRKVAPGRFSLQA